METDCAVDAIHQSESRTERRLDRPPAAALALLALAGWTAWRPVETFAFSAVVVAAVILGLTTWGWRRSTWFTSGGWLTVALAALVLAGSGLSGWDPASAIGDLALAAAVVSLIWLASRTTPPERWPAFLALIISALALWGAYQVAAGPARAAEILTQLPDHLRAAAAERLANHRAFASLMLPSHLAVLLATALPLLLARIHRSLRAWPWVGGSCLCAVGLVLTKSPIGIALALAACLILAASRRRLSLWWAAPLLIVILIAVVLGRSDVMELEPFRLRFDNWRAAVWVWSTAPAAGVGVGGFAQAAQMVPFVVGNRPQHAHSLPFELLAEGGPVGLLAALLAFVLLGRLARRLWREHPELAVAIVVVPFHNLVDFSLYNSGVALPWAILVGWAIAIRRRQDPPAASAGGRIAAVAAAAVAVAAVTLHATSITVEESAAQVETPREKMVSGLDARALAPWRIDPLGLIGAGALESGDPEQLAVAIEVLDDSRWLRPRSSALAGLRARLALASSEVPTGVSEAWLSHQLQPSSVPADEYFNDLLSELERGPDHEKR